MLGMCDSALRMRKSGDIKQQVGVLQYQREGMKYVYNMAS